jgi:phosphate acyltransferase
MARVALDVMGSDMGPAELVAGAAQLSCEQKAVETLLVGDAEVIEDALGRVDYNPRYLQVVHADQYVKMDLSPKEELLKKPEASILVASRLVRDGHADAMVSAGNTGAVILTCVQEFELLNSIRRCAMAAVYPTEQRHGPKGDPFALMLDVGATLHVKAIDLVGFALMGSAYAQIISDNPSPKVALLSNGTEATKGAPEVVEAHAILSQLDTLNFIGNVEGLDIPKGTADVIVCEGFMGNVSLKMLEGVTEVAVELAKDAYARKFLWRLGLSMLSKGLRQLQTMTDWKQYGGAPVLGFSSLAIKAHGRSNHRAIRNAIKVAAKAVDGGLTEKIQENLSSVSS